MLQQSGRLFFHSLHFNISHSYQAYMYIYIHIYINKRVHIYTCARLHHNWTRRCTRWTKQVKRALYTAVRQLLPSVLHTSSMKLSIYIHTYMYIHTHIYTYIVGHVKESVITIYTHCTFIHNHLRMYICIHILFYIYIHVYV